jgi:hypothetical protein
MNDESNLSSCKDVMETNVHGMPFATYVLIHIYGKSTTPNKASWQEYQVASETMRDWDYLLCDKEATDHFFSWKVGLYLTL